MSGANGYYFVRKMLDNSYSVSQAAVSEEEASAACDPHFTPDALIGLFRTRSMALCVVDLLERAEHEGHPPCCSWKRGNA